MGWFFGCHGSGSGRRLVESGNVIHGLRVFRELRLAGEAGGDPLDRVAAFDDWVDERATAGDLDALANYRDRAPFAVEAHPRDAHYLPLLVAAAGGEGSRGRRLHRHFMFRSLSVAAYAFGEAGG